MFFYTGMVIVMQPCKSLLLPPRGKQAKTSKFKIQFFKKIFLEHQVVVVSLLRMCQTHKHIQSNIKHLNEVKDLIKNIEYTTMV